MQVLRLQLNSVIYCLSVPIGALAAIPSSWREPSFSISRAGKAFVAKSALDLLVGGLNSSSGVVTDPSPGLDIAQSATFIQTLSRYDQLTGNRTYESHALAAFTAFRNQYPKLSPYVASVEYRIRILTSSIAGYASSIHLITLHSDTARWGLAAYYASTVYDGQTQISFLEGAKAAWNLLQPFQLTPDIALSGHLSSIDATFEPSCNGSSVQGAVLWLEQGDVLTNSETMGPYIALSSYLYNATHNETYSYAANIAIGFTQTFLSDGKTPIHESIYLNNCTMGVSNDLTYNSGYFVEGLAAYTAMTGDHSQQGYLNSLVQSLLMVPEWYRSDYVMKGGTFSDTEYALIDSTQPDEQTLVNSRQTSDWKVIFLSGLYTSLRFGLLESELAQNVSAIIAIQYNAIRGLANSTVNGQLAYSPSWTGQPLPFLATWGQLTAAEVLTTALNVTTSNDTTTDSSWMYPSGSISPTSSSDPWSNSVPTRASPSGTAMTSSSSTSRAIAGGVVGASLAFGILLGLCYWRRRRGRRAAPIELEIFAEPYTGTMQDFPNHGRPARVIVPAMDAPGRLLKVEPMRERNVTSGSIHQPSLTPSLTGSVEAIGRGQTHPERPARAVVDVGVLQRLLTGIHEVRATLSDLQQHQAYNVPSHVSDPPEYGDVAQNNP
ncbi:unnamed protein product [Peniophora sp. CBMAI 1063]|nr:unnamed protein product [Peniophora sp. CBMAI 1063]